jgi:hypothetical protein
VARTHLVGDRRPGQAGVGRPALLIAGAVVAAVLVLAAGALRSGPGASASPPAGSSGALESLDLASLPAPTVAPTIDSTAAPPEATAIPSLRGEFVGALGVVETCPILYHRDGVFELILSDPYRSRVRGDGIQILDGDRVVLASEGDLLGLDGAVREGGSLCMAGPQLHVSEIVEVVRRTRD